MNKDLAQRALQDLASALDSLVEAGAITSEFAHYTFSQIAKKVAK